MEIPQRRLIEWVGGTALLLAAILFGLWFGSRAKPSLSPSSSIAVADAELVSDQAAVVRVPGRDPPRNGWPTMVLLHGRASSALKIGSLATAIRDSGMAVVAPYGPSKLGDDQYEWPADAVALGHYLDDSVATAGLVNGLRFDRECVYIGGFSQGGGIALWLAAQRPGFAGVLAISPVPPARPQPSRTGSVPAWIFAGIDDPLALKPAREAEDAWRAIGWPVHLQTYSGGHQPPDDWAGRIREAVIDLLHSCHHGGM